MCSKHKWHSKNNLREDEQGQQSYTTQLKVKSPGFTLKNRHVKEKLLNRNVKIPLRVKWV